MTTPTTTPVTGEALLDCPFCGSPSYLSVSTHWETEGMMRIACTSDATVCPVAPYVTASSRSGAIAAWNRRSPIPTKENDDAR